MFDKTILLLKFDQVSRSIPGKKYLKWKKK